MRTIIAGSRTITSLETVKRAVEACGWTITTVVSGAARGVDKLGERWAWQNNIPVDPYPAQWKKFGDVAGYIRNGEMAKNADALIAVWDGMSGGTANMIKQARERNLKVFVYKVDVDS